MLSLGKALLLKWPPKDLTSRFALDRQKSRKEGGGYLNRRSTLSTILPRAFFFQEGQFAYLGQLKVHRGWVTSLACPVDNTPSLLSASRGMHGWTHAWSAVHNKKMTVYDLTFMFCV